MMPKICLRAFSDSEYCTVYDVRRFIKKLAFKYNLDDITDKYDLDDITYNNIADEDIDRIFHNYVPIFFIEQSIDINRNFPFARYVTAQFVYDFINHNITIGYKIGETIETFEDGVFIGATEGSNVCYDDIEELFEIKSRFIEIYNKTEPNITSLLANIIEDGENRYKLGVWTGSRISLQSTQTQILSYIPEWKYRIFYDDAQVKQIRLIGALLALLLDMILVERIMQKYSIGIYDTSNNCSNAVQTDKNSYKQQSVNIRSQVYDAVTDYNTTQEDLKEAYSNMSDRAREQHQANTKSMYEEAAEAQAQAQAVIDKYINKSPTAQTNSNITDKQA